MLLKIPWNKVVSFYSTTWRTFHCGCKRRTLCCFGEKYRGFWQQHFDATETFGTDNADVSVWEHVGLILVHFRSRPELCVVIQTTVAKILYDIPNTLPLCGGSEGVHSGSLGRHVRGWDLHQILCEVTASLQTKGGVRQSETFVDGHCVRHTVTRIHHEARRPSRNVQDKQARHLHGVHVEVISVMRSR